MEELAASLRSRVRRAVALGDELGTHIQQWMASEPFRVLANIAADRLSWDMCVEVDPAPFDEWSTRFSDAIHNLRSALDNLVWGLATLDGTVPKNARAIQFPLVGKAADWPAESKRIAELPMAARLAIESIQPFQRSGPDDAPERDALLLLSRMSNSDKHRVMIRPELNPAELSHSFSVQFRSDEEAALNVPPGVTLSADVFVSGTTLLRHVTKTPIVKVLGGYEFKGQVVVQDSVFGSLGITTVLAQLATYVPQVLDHVLLNVALARSAATDSSPPDAS